jgi:RNA polymerase sigma-70 factor (ECF subfamily)
MPGDEPDEPLASLLPAAAAGDAEAWRKLLRHYHSRLRRMVALRMDARLQGRMDPSDVLQDAYIDAADQLPGYVTDPKIPFFLWLRLVTGHRLAKLHRFHLGQQIRDVAREVSIFHGALPEASSAALAAQLLGRDAEPIENVLRAELRERVVAALHRLDPIDREVLSLRHFEQLSNAEAAQVLDISEAAAVKRYVRALERLREIIEQVSTSGLFDR